MQQELVNGVEVTMLQPDQSLPQVVRPTESGIYLESWLSENIEFIETLLLRSGAVLFRGFPVHTPEALEEIVSLLAPQLLNYIEGSSPRIRLTEKVYTSTEYPPEFDISMHNELSYAHKWPAKLFFLCLQAAQSGGETPLADSRKVYQLLDQAIVDKFIEKGVKYVRNLHNGRGVGLSWQTVFETDDRATVERYCQEGDIEYEWTRRGGLRTSQIRPSVIKHPRTGDLLWFNQVDQWHPTNLTEAVRTSMLALMSEKDLPINAYYGDGSPLEVDVLDKIRQAFKQTTIKFPWQEGDVLLVDNTMVAHGRSSYTGPRKVVLAMGGVVSLDEVEALGSK